MFFSIVLLILTFATFFAIKAKTFDRLGAWSQGTIVALASIATAAILTMQFFIAVRRTWEAFVAAIAGVPWLVIGFVFLLLLVLVVPFLRLLGRLDMAQVKRYWHEEVVPRQKNFTRSAVDLFRTFTWDRTKSLFRRVVPFGGGRGGGGEPEDPYPPADPEDRDY